MATTIISVPPFAGSRKRRLNAKHKAMKPGEAVLNLDRFTANCVAAYHRQHYSKCTTVRQQNGLYSVRLDEAETF